MYFLIIFTLNHHMINNNKQTCSIISAEIYIFVAGKWKMISYEKSLKSTITTVPNLQPRFASSALCTTMMQITD